jgi:hypothetical protein
MPLEKIDSLADDVKPLVLELLRQNGELTVRVNELLAQNKALLARIAELEAKHGKPPTTRQEGPVFRLWWGVALRLPLAGRITYCSGDPRRHRVITPTHCFHSENAAVLI